MRYFAAQAVTIRVIEYSYDEQKAVADLKERIRRIADTLKRFV